MQSPVILDKHETESVNDNIVWSEPDNETLLELEKRAETVNEVCRKRNLLSQPINNKEFFVDSKHKLIWCNIFKAASSSWMYYFNILGKIYGFKCRRSLDSQIFYVISIASQLQMYGLTSAILDDRVV